MISPPSRGKPHDPRNTEQVVPGPIIHPPKVPDLGKISFQKCSPGKFGGRFMKVGKK